MDYVEKFAHEVKARKLPEEDSKDIRAINLPNGNNEQDTMQDGEAQCMDDNAPAGEGDPTDAIHLCVRNWKSAKSEEMKKTWAIFDETAKIMEVAGADTCGGYDIGCSFLATILSSSLGPEFKRLHSKMCVNVFHGYSHNFVCQSIHYPNVITGIGLEDLETLECMFSSSNQLASVIRYASVYNHCLFINVFFKQWDNDKYANLATMIYSNYVQALTIIKHDSPAMAEAMQVLGVQAGDLEKWETKEAGYLRTVVSRR
ncbi:hypothetical protein PHLCEN_2v2950 [Hermanssonia centrifuga]|uniref:Uncharacterized protein n=1 Tax=Hermanssonia centrifuga TaxID=98765 RepID=A0A2R6RHS0_9APHY|nr:hypothetical protein PHLCEN_2v2950 [Hermanssonia centrifuga]